MFTKNQISNLQKQSENILNVFTKTQTELKEVNKKISDEVQKRDEQVRILTEEVTSLTNLKTQNEKVVTKLENFLND